MRRIFFVLLFVLISTSAAEAQIVLKNVTVKGNNRVEESTILVQAKLKVSLPYSAVQVTNDIKEIYRTGFFDKVYAKLENVNKSSTQGDLVFYVHEKPAVRKVIFKGNKEYDEDKLKEKFSLSSKQFLDNKKIQAGIDEIKKFYQTEGYYETAVEYQTLAQDDNQVDVEIKVSEGVKKLIRQIEFVGNKDIDSDDLRENVETTRYKWWSSWLTGSGVVKEDVLDNDTKEINKYYLNHGYVNVQVAKPSVEKAENGLKVVFKITEGEKYEFGTITARGDLLKNNLADTLSGIEIKEGETFNLDKLRKDTFTVSDKFTDIGYAFANVEPATEILREQKKVNVNFVINKGNVITINRINISGNKKTKDNVVRRSLQIEEQQLFSSSKVRRSQELLQRLGYFEEVTLSPQPAAEKDTVDMDVSVKEGNTGSFTLGAGLSSGEGFIFTSRVAENNLFGTGNSLSFDANTGTRRENFVVSFNNPRVDDTQLSLGVDVLSSKRIYDDFDRDQVGGSATVGYPLYFLGEDLANDVRGSLTYELSKIKIKNVEDTASQFVKDSEGDSTSSSLTPQLTRNTIDNPLDPSKGSKQQVSVEVAGIGGDQEFWLLQASNTFYYPVWKSSFGNFVFSQRTRLGYGETFDNEDFPLFKRFFPGGINSVRGFDSRELGPEDANGNNFGGNKQLVGNFEMIYPLVQSVGLSGVVFYDIGNAFDDGEGIRLNDLRQAYGWGIRWRSPLAPIRIEFGCPIDKKDGEKSFVPNFSFGAPL